MTVEYPAAATIPADQTAAEDISTVSTTGTNFEKLVWRGQFLTIITLGIYRFWYKTDLRRWYASNTLVGSVETGGQHGFEYRGTAKEKFLGFLYALAVVLPIYFLGTIIALFANENLGNIVSSISVLVIAFLVQYGAYRSRRYRLTRTIWRGLRFDLKGSAWTYALKSAGWGFLTLITLGLAFPAMRRALEEYRINNTWFGSAQGVFTAKTGPLMKRWIVLWLGAFLIVVTTPYALASIFFTGSFAAILIFMALSLLCLCVVWPWYRANEIRHFTDATRIGEVSFTSAFPTRPYFWLFFKVGLTAVAMTTLFLAFLISFYSHLFSWPPKEVSSGAIVGMTLVYLSLFFLFSYFKETILNRGFWKLAASTLTIHNLSALDDVIGTSVADEAATGEGLADALDFGGI